MAGSERDGRIISLETFDPTSHKEPIITSPRSVEACRRQGINPTELILRNVAEIKEMYKDKNLDKEGYELMARHYEERRREKVRVLREVSVIKYEYNIKERLQLIEDEKNGIPIYTGSIYKDKKSLTMNSTMHQSVNKSVMGGTDSTLIEREKKQLEKIKERQQKEIKNLIEYETKMAEIKATAEEKLERQRERDREREAEAARKRKQEEERKRQKDLEKKQKEDEEAERQRLLALEEFKKAQAKTELEKDAAKQRALEAKRREEEQRTKNEQFKRETETKLADQQAKIQKRKEEMEMQDQIRQEALRRKHEDRLREAEQKRREHEEKLRKGREAAEEALNQKKREYEQKQAEVEEKRRLYEIEAEQKKEEARRKAEEHEKFIQKVLDDNKNLEEKRKQDYLQKMALAEAKQKELDEVERQKREYQRQLDQKKEEDRQNVKKTMEERLNMRITGFLNKQDQADQMVQQAQKRKEDDMKNRKTVHVIKQNDKLENVKRIQQMQEYQKEKLLEKIENDTDKANRIKGERANLLAMRAEIRRQMDKNKRELLTQFEKVKQGKATLESVSGELGKSISGGNSINKPNETLNQSTQKPLNRSSSAKASQRGQPKKAAQKKESTITDSTLPKDIGNEKEARKAIEQLKLKQNHEMLVVLEEEQVKENQRETKMNTVTDPQEKKRLEKIYAMERAKAHARIQGMADSHEEAVKQMMAKFNLKSIQ